MADRERIAIVGAGLMGHGIAQVFATAGHPVRLTDSNREVLGTARDRVGGNLARMVAGGIRLDDEIDVIVGRIRTTEDLAEACAGADFVFEAVFENLPLKQEMFERLDRLASPTAILATNTSGLSVTAIATRATHQERIATTHFWAPPHLIALVEVVMSANTSEKTATAMLEFLRR